MRQGMVRRGRGKIKEEKRYCKNCGKILKPRITSTTKLRTDKKYCGDVCRTRFNARKKYHKIKDSEEYKEYKKGYNTKWREENKEKWNTYYREYMREHPEYWKGKKKTQKVAKVAN